MGKNKKNKGKSKVKVYAMNSQRNEMFEKLVVKSQMGLKNWLRKWFDEREMHWESADGYLYHKGTHPVLLVAHMDSFFDDNQIKTIIYRNNCITSPQYIVGDDRCGVYMILKVLEEFDCHVVFLEDEEIGCKGAEKFAKTDICKGLRDDDGVRFIVEFDRKGNRDAVTYSCDNKSWDDFLESTHFFKKAVGTSSDISRLMPASGLAGVNFSCGYYKEHTLQHYVNLTEMELVIEAAKMLIRKASDMDNPFRYIAKVGYYGNSSWDWDDYYGRSNYTTYSTIKYAYKVLYKSGGEILEETIPDVYSETTAWWSFCVKHKDVTYNDMITIKKVEVEK